MKNCFAAFAIAMATSAAWADSVQVSPENVMTGNSSAFADGVWVRVPGQPGHANCYHSGLNMSLFYTYARSNGPIDPKKAFALLLSAKLAGRTVSIEYNPASSQADFWGYGISRCEIERLVLN